MGDVIEPHTSESVLRGHGTLLRDGSLVASRCGVVQRWNQLVLVEPLAGGYTAAVGHVVVGRIVQVRGVVASAGGSCFCCILLTSGGRVPSTDRSHDAGTFAA